MQISTTCLPVLPAYPENGQFTSRNSKLSHIFAEIMNEMKKVYFAGSIRGGRADAELYKRVIEYIKRGNIVLTEHIGDLSLSKVEDSDVAIYEQDTAWLKESDIVIAECTTTSLGVGYELGFAEAHGIPVHIFYDESRTRLSAMLAGNRNFHIHPYNSEAEIYQLLDAIL